MKNLSDRIIEVNRTVPANFSKFDKYQLHAIKTALAKKGGAKVSFKLDTKRTSIQKITAKVIPGDYPKLEMNYIDPEYGVKNLKGQFFIHDKGIDAGAAIESLETRSIVDFSYDESKNITTITFAVKYFGINSDWRHIWGEVTFKLNGNCVTPEAEKLDFDGKKFVSYMKEYLPKKEEYLSSFNWDEEILDCYAEYREAKKELYIELYLECGKGYGSHHRSEDYRFEHDGTQYLSIDGHRFYDRDHEAQIIRKFRSGVMNFIKRLSCPQYLTIHVEQELD